MRTITSPLSWVVYQVALGRHVSGVNAVCEQGEWEAMQRAQLGDRTLIRAGIPTVGEAQRFAKGVPLVGAARGGTDTAGRPALPPETVHRDPPS
jgi:hypothetical protein